MLPSRFDWYYELEAIMNSRQRGIERICHDATSYAQEMAGYISFQHSITQQEVDRLYPWQDMDKFSDPSLAPRIKRYREMFPRVFTHSMMAWTGTFLESISYDTCNDVFELRRPKLQVMNLKRFSRTRKLQKATIFRAQDYMCQVGGIPWVIDRDLRNSIEDFNFLRNAVVHNNLLIPATKRRRRIEMYPGISVAHDNQLILKVDYVLFIIDQMRLLSDSMRLAVDAKCISLAVQMKTMGIDTSRERRRYFQ